ncbi:DUF2742 domain-containing protein [Streptomyces sp. CC210A]|uniref:DUF2742 domain-containing protein n=1 Tax=Streptomyces sp. CC210A TaxID=2898184 RepID=UPI001F4634F8|nr:DUF2742 domain-containing protein [Streptomyces sp. CC210A]
MTDKKKAPALLEQSEGSSNLLGGGSHHTVTQPHPQQEAAPTARRRLRAVPDNVMPGEITALRAETQIAALGVDTWPTYGTPEWLRLNPRDPRCYAATLEAAELHRRAEAERQRLDQLMDNDPETWWREITTEATSYAATRGRVLAARRTAEELRVARDRAHYRPPHKLQATPGWPPIAVPGQPGRYLTPGQESA